VAVRSILADDPNPHLKAGTAPARRRRYGRSINILRQLAAGKPLNDTPPDHTALQRRLVLLEEEISRGRAQFARQLDIVAGIERRHGDATAARERLQLFAQAHVIRLDDRDRLARLLEGAVG
jgi:hypothetical protein